MLVILLMLVVRVLRAPMVPPPRLARFRHRLALVAALAIGALAVERAYYVAARLLRPHGVDLWQAHPAPSVLSALVCAALYAACVPLIQAARPEAEARARVGGEMVALGALWGLLAGGLA
jgi:hypothetical protein